MAGNGIQPYTRTNPKGMDVKNVEDSIVNCWQSILLNPLLQNISFVQGIVLTGGINNYVSHGLGKPYNGWFQVRNNADSVVYESGTVNTNPSAQIILASSVTVTCSFIFF